jgi:hypothetical protein
VVWRGLGLAGGSQEVKVICVPTSECGQRSILCALFRPPLAWSRDSGPVDHEDDFVIRSDGLH